MKTTVTTIAPVLLPFLFAFAPSTGITSYARDSVDRSSQPTTYSGGTERAKQRETTVSLGSQNKSLTQTASARLNLDSPRLANWLESAVIKLSNYQGIEDGWKGEGTLAPTPSALDEAKELAAQFATEMPTVASPSISADDDGSICFYWSDGVMMATVSIHGDGTYAFYAEGYDDAIRSDGAAVGMPLPAGLIAAMSGIAVPTVIVV